MFTNPMVAGFHPDPSVCRVGEDYYLACSSFEYLPGIPIYHSRDLVTWSPVCHVVTRPDQLALRDVPTLGGAWAPTLRHHDGRFWLVITDAMGRGNLIFTADRPEGPWSDGTPMAGVSGIDPDIAWDDDGTCYVTYSGLCLDGERRGEHLGILQVRMDLDTGRALEAPRPMWSGTGRMFPEGPHLYQIEGTWYLLIAEGGTERGHSVSVARSARPDGPFTGCPANPLLTAAGTDRPVQNTGHADLVRRVDGGWSALLLGMRTKGMTRAFSPMGRETFRTDVTWDDGWPALEPVLLGGPGPSVSETHDFDRPRLGPEWLSIRTPAEDWSSLTARPGWLVLRGDCSTMDDQRPRFVGLRQRHTQASLTAAVDADEGVGGLSLRMDELHHADVEVDGPNVRARVRLDQIRQTWSRPIPPGHSGPVLLRIAAEPPEPNQLSQLGPDLLRLSMCTDNENWTEVASFDGRYICAETAASFAGRVCGVFVSSGTVAFDWVRYQGCDG